MSHEGCIIVAVHVVSNSCHKMELLGHFGKFLIGSLNYCLILIDKHLHYKMSNRAKVDTVKKKEEKKGQLNLEF